MSGELLDRSGHGRTRRVLKRAKIIDNAVEVPTACSTASPAFDDKTADAATLLLK